MGATGSVAHHFEIIISACKVDGVFLVTFEVGLNKGIFSCFMVSIGVEVCIFKYAFLIFNYDFDVIFHLLLLR